MPGVAVVSSALPIGAATSANQTTTNTTLSTINTKIPTPTVRTPTFTVITNGAGTIAAGAKSISIYNSGPIAATVLGSSLSAGETLNIQAPDQDTLSSVAFNCTGTTLKYLEVR
jgi:hypothetical protein